MDERIVTALNYIEANYKKTLDLKKVSKVSHLSIYHFHRLFKSETGIPLRRFVELLKIEKAYRLITETDADIKKLAFELGYNDYETFARAFKRIHQMTPSLFKAIVDDARKGVTSTSTGVKTMVFHYQGMTEEEVTHQLQEQLQNNPDIPADASTVRVYMVTSKQAPAASAGQRDGRKTYHWHAVLEKNRE